MHGENHTQVWIADLAGIIPSITGKIELVYEGEQEGPYQVALNLIDKAIRTLFVQYFPNPDTLKKRRSTGKGNASATDEYNPFKPITGWFDGGNHLDILVDATDRQKIDALYKVSGLHALITNLHGSRPESETALLMEFVLHGLAAYSLISKKNY